MNAVRVCEVLSVLVGLSLGSVYAGRVPMLLGRDNKPRTLQMIGSVNPRMLHRISADLQPDTSKVVHIQVPYYIERPKVRAKKFQPWIPRGQRFVSTSGGAPLQQTLLPGSISFGTPFPAREAPFKGKPIFPQEFATNPGPYDTPFVPVMKPSPVMHVDAPTPEISFEPISILPLESPSFATVRNHVNFLKQKQQAFFEGQGRQFGFGGGPIPDELDYFGEQEKRLGEDSSVHNGDASRQGGERNTLSEDDFGKNDRKYDRRGTASGPSGEEDFYDSDGKQYQDDDFEDSREEADRVAAFEPKKVYTQVRHHEVVRHIPRSEDDDRRENEDEREERDEDQDGEDDEEERDDDEEEEDEEGNDRNLPIRERVKLERKNIVYSEKGREASDFDHGSEESFGQFEQKQEPKKNSRRNRIKRDVEQIPPPEEESNRTLSDQVVDVLAMMILSNASGIPLSELPQPEALVDPRELHGEELIRFLDEAIQNTTQYLPDSRSDEREVISIVSPPSNVVKFPYYNRPETEIDLDSALRYAENLTTFSRGLYGGKTADGIVCNEVDVELEDEPEPIPDDDAPEGFKPIRRLKGLGDKIDCLKAKHFGREPLDNPLFREEFVGVTPRKMYMDKGATTAAVPSQKPQQPNPAVAVYNDVIRHIKKHLASQQRRKNSKVDAEQDTVMIAVPRVLRLDRDDEELTRKARKREPRLAFHQSNPLPVSNHISVPIFDISKFVPRFMMRPNDDLYADDELPPPRTATATVKPRMSSPKVRLHTLVKTAEQLAEGAVSVEESVEKRLPTAQTPIRDDIADAFDDVLAKPNQQLAPLPPIKPYDVVEQDTKDTGPEPTFNKSGPPYAALALEPPVAQSILKQRIAPLERNQLDHGKSKRMPTKPYSRKTRRPSITRKKVLVFYH